MDTDTDIDWLLCCLCQYRDSTTGLRSTTEGRASLGKQLIEFKNNQLKIPDVFYNSIDGKELGSHLESNGASYHKNCHSNYSKKLKKESCICEISFTRFQEAIVE